MAFMRLTCGMDSMRDQGHPPVLPLTYPMNRKETPKPPAQSLPESPAQPATEASASNLPKAYDPSAIEQRWAEYWVRERLFDVPTPATEPGAPSMERSDMGGNSKENFTLLLPPPNVTGRLHMGHMLNQTEMDILTRWHRMRGQTSLWVPGTDHAGIATQMMVERQLAAEGTNRKPLGREVFTARVWEWKRQYGSAITDQMRRLGASVDWSREYFTMDDHLNVAVKDAFVRLYEQGLIYRGSYIVNWDPIQQTAVSDLEVTHEDRVDKLYHIRYPFADGTGSIVVATTRPETMLGDTAVAVNPADERYTAFIGKVISLPLSAVNGSPNREIPVLADEWAQPEFGTGAVKVTPAHDPNDFAIGQRHALPSLTILDTTAHIDLSGSPYHGLDRFAARKRIVADLDALGLLVDIKDHNLAIAISQRSGAVIEPRLSMQWFLAVNKAPEGAGGFSPLNTPAQEGGFSPGGVARDSIAAKAIAAVREGHIHFTPEMYSKTYFEWMSNIHDWCISRQLWWGHRIPAWHCADCRALTVARETPAACATCGSANITQETDVLDTWFSSGLLPFTVFGWPGTASTNNQQPATNNLTPDLAAFYPTSLLVTGFDILFFWVARMIMLGTHFMLDVPMPDGSPRKLAEAVPFKAVYIHALVRDADRQKMSKTKGNVIDPIEIIERFGTDAVRFTLASMASPGTDIAFSEARTEGNRAFANKIWNAARFLFMNLDRAREAGIEVTLPTHTPATDPGAPSIAVSSRLGGIDYHRRPRIPLDSLPPPRRLRRGPSRTLRLPLRRSRQRHLPILLGRPLRLVPRNRQAPPQLRADQRSSLSNQRRCRGLGRANQSRSHHIRPRLRVGAAPSLALHALPHRRDLARPLRWPSARQIHRPHPLPTAARLCLRRGRPRRDADPTGAHRHNPRPAQGIGCSRTRVRDHPDPRRRTNPRFTPVQSGHPCASCPRQRHRSLRRPPNRQQRSQHRELRYSRPLRAPDRRARRARAPH